MADVRTVDVSGVTIAYRDTGPGGPDGPGRPGGPGSGDGPPVVLLHGGSSCAATWDHLTARLVAAGHRVIAADLRGHGGSSRPDGYPLTGFRDDVVGLLDALELSSIALVGHSLGAHIASRVAQARPERITRLVLEEPPVPPRAGAERSRLSSVRFLVPGLLGLFSRRGFHRRALASAVSQLRVPDPEWWDRLPAIVAPTLVISGGPSSYLPPRRLADVADALPDARLVTIPVGHRVHSLSPERFHAVVGPFLDGRSGYPSDAPGFSTA